MACTDHDAIIYIGNVSVSRLRPHPTPPTRCCRCAQGHAAWEAALVNSMEEGDTGLVLSTGTFAKSWGEIAESVGVLVETIDFGMSATVSSSLSPPPCHRRSQLGEAAR